VPKKGNNKPARQVVYDGDKDENEYKSSNTAGGFSYGSDYGDLEEKLVDWQAKMEMH